MRGFCFARQLSPRGACYQLATNPGALERLAATETARATTSETPKLSAQTGLTVRDVSAVSAWRRGTACLACARSTSESSVQLTSRRLIALAAERRQHRSPRPDR
jgi:hypothetical protein